MKDDWPFLTLHLPPWAGLPVHLQLQHFHSSLSYASCASCVSYLFYVSSPSSFSSSFHCHQHLKSGMTKLSLLESQCKREQPPKILLLCLSNSNMCPPSSNLAWGRTPGTTVGLFGWWWRRTGWARWWQGSGCSSWTFVSCRRRWNRSGGSSSHGLRTWTLSAKDKHEIHEQSNHRVKGTCFVIVAAEITSGYCVALECVTLCGWVCHYVEEIFSFG